MQPPSIGPSRRGMLRLVVTISHKERQKSGSSAFLFILNNVMIPCLPPHPCNAALA